MKASDILILKGTVRKCQDRNGMFTFQISKKRKIKDVEQFTTFFCSKWKPNDYFLKAVQDGNFVELVGSMWSREVDGKTYWSVDVSDVLQYDYPRAAEATHPQVQSNAPAVEDDLPF